MEESNMTSTKQKHPLVLLLLALLFIGLGCTAAMGVKVALNALGIQDTIPGKLVQMTAVIFLITAAYRFYLKKFEPGTRTGYPKQNWIRHIALGLTTGAGLILFQVLFLTVTGHFRLEGFQPSGEVLKYMFFMIVVGFLEELVTRGVIFRLTEKWAGSIAALLITAVEGGLTHATNPNATLLSSIAVGLEFGILVSLVYMSTRNLWTVSALHFAWNFTMGGLFDITVSGTEAQSLFRASLTGPDYLTGGAFGIEAGLPALVLTIGISLWLILKLKNSGGFRKRQSACDQIKRDNS